MKPCRIVSFALFYKSSFSSGGGFRTARAYCGVSDVGKTILASGNQGEQTGAYPDPTESSKIEQGCSFLFIYLPTLSSIAYPRIDVGCVCFTSLYSKLCFGKFWPRVGIANPPHPHTRWDKIPTFSENLKWEAPLFILSKTINAEKVLNLKSSHDEIFGFCLTHCDCGRGNVYFFYFLCFCFLSLFLLPSKKFTCWQIPAIVPGWLWQLWAACCLPPRQLDQLPRPHNAMNGIRQDVQMMVMITVISISSKQLVYQSDPDPTQLINLNKTLWTQLRYLLLCSWKMQKVTLWSF